MKKFKKLLPIILTVATYLILTGLISGNVINRYYVGIIISCCINIILVASLNITCGYLGQLTLGHAGFMAVGAYSSAFLTKEILTFLPEPFGFIIALIVGGIISIIFGLIIGIPTLRLKGDYLAIITLAFNEVIRVILLNLNIVGGAKGYSGITRITTFNWCYIFVVITLATITLFMRSRHGRAIIAIREDEIAAEASGISLTKYKLLGFILAAFFAGIAGGLYAHYIGIIQPRAFTFNKSIEILVMVVLGGMGSLVGGIISAILLTIIPELLRSVSAYRTLFYSIVLIVFMLLKNKPEYLNKLKTCLRRKKQ